MQLKHSESKFKTLKFPVVLVCDKIRTPENIGMIFRVAESFGVDKIILEKESPSPTDRSVKRISRDANKQVKFDISEDLPGEIEDLKIENYKIVALEITSDSKPISQLKAKNQKIALVLGAERNGISKKLLDLCEEKYHIDMYGNNSSMNVVNALSVALYEITNKMLRD